MLVEMMSPAFKEKDEVRPPIRFKDGLNVVLGKEDGTNSIGKSSALLAIDFVFGGNTYIASDGVKHIGDHTIFFTFKFDGKEYYFARNTASPEEIQVCSKGYELTGSVKTRQEFVDWLKEKYNMDFPGLSFRSTMSSFFRVYGKDNTNERKPLYGIPGDGMQKSIDRLVKLFDRYRDIEDYTSRLEEQKKKLSAYREARKYRFVSDLVGGKEKYDENLAEIHSLQVELDTLTSEQVETHSEEDIEKNKLKSDLKDKKFRLEESIETKKRRLSLLDMSLSYGLYPTEADLSGLQEFFPEVNLRKLYEVEGYHKKLASILDGQFAAERDSVQREIEDLHGRLRVFLGKLAVMDERGNAAHGKRKARGAGGLLPQYAQREGKALVRHTHIVAAHADGGDHVIRADEGFYRVGGSGELQLGGEQRANLARHAAEHGKLFFVIIHKDELFNIQFVGALRDAFRKEHGAHTAAADHS